VSEGVLVNVCGVPRSGTTLLDLMLGGGEGAFSCGEVYAYFRPFDPRHFTAHCACRQRPCPVWQKLDDVPEERVHRELVDRLGVRTVTDSSKDLDWVSDANRWASESGMRVANVLIWKEPLRQGYSFWKRGWLRGVEGPKPAWRPKKDLGLEDIVGYYERFFEMRLPYVAVSYENLVDSPAEMLSSICGALDVDYRHGQEHFWESGDHHLFGNGIVGRRLVHGDEGIFETKLPAKFLEAAAGFAAEVEESERAQAVIARLKAADVGTAG
jgi:LPS sulfotransferase NodH